MQDLGKVTIKTKFGGGLNLLCCAIAGFITVKTINELNKVVNRNKLDKQMKEALDAVKTIDEIYDKLNNDVKEKEEEES